MSNGFVEKSIGVVASIQPESGQWTVFLDISFWNENTQDSPIKTLRRRITTYPTRSRAEIAAGFIVRAVARDLPHPPLGL